ncbi:MAG: helix-turn-helix domain-containing protein [Proteobacteria bacterium]|nr:helix-turn-helix domain-containing protein [Pseudomonadota bacterium]
MPKSYGRVENYDNDRYLDLKGLSEYSSLSVRTLREYLIYDGDPIPSYCIRRKILVKRSEFDSWIKRYRTDSNKIGPSSDDLLNELTRI